MGKGSCPSCGSQLASEVTFDDSPIDDDEIPGLDDVVEALGGTEDIEDSDEVLPFGLGAVPEMMKSNLPFGVGSFTDERIEYQISEDDDFEDIQNQEPKKSSSHNNVDDSQTEISEKKNQTRIVDEVVSEPEVEYKQEAESVPLPKIESVDVELPVANVEPSSDSSKPVRLSAEPIQVAETKTDVEAELIDEIPDMWRIDAASVNIEEIYSQDDKIVEVTYDEDQFNSDVEVSFDDFHYSAVEESIASDDDAPELHPAKALPIDDSTVPELSNLISQGFEMMASQSWLQAAQIFSTVSSNMQNEPSVLNNLGLCILQSALEMDAEGDSMADSQYEASIMALRQGAKIDATNNTILLNLAHCLLVSGRAQKALGIVDVLQSRITGNVEVDNLKGACLIQLERESEAKQILMPYSSDSVVAKNLSLI